jgi:hypothetical protein
MAEDPDDALLARMEKAVDDQDFELAARLRDEIAALPGSKLRRQVPGKMGLGTDQSVYTPPKGWKRPAKPDPMTAGHKPRRGG